MDRPSVWRRRVLLVGWLLALGVICIRAGQVQIAQASEWRSMAESQHRANRQNGRFFAGTELITCPDTDFLWESIFNGQAAGFPIKAGHPRDKDGVPLRIQKPQLVADPEVSGVGTTGGVDEAIVRGKLCDLPLGGARTENLVRNQFIIRRAGDAIGERAADVDPEFPAVHGETENRSEEFGAFRLRGFC